MSNNGTQNVTNRLDELTLKTPRNQGISPKTTPKAPKKTSIKSINTRMNNSSARRPLLQGETSTTSGSENPKNKVIRMIRETYTLNNSASLKVLTNANLTNNQIEAVAGRTKLNLTGLKGNIKESLQKLKAQGAKAQKEAQKDKKAQKKAITIQKQAEAKAQKEAQKEAEREEKGIRPASDYKSLVVGSKIYTGGKGTGKESKEKESLALTLGRYASRIKYFKFKRSALLNINRENYKRFVTCFDAGAEGGSLKSMLLKSKAPYLTSVATMYDPGHKFRKDWHLNHYIKGAWYYFKRHHNKLQINNNQRYPDHFVDFSPIYINFLYGEKTIYTKIEFLGGANINKPNNSENKINKNAENRQTW